MEQFRFTASDEEVASHFSAVFSIFQKDGELMTRLVVYDDKYTPGFELRVPGGNTKPWEDETFEKTASRESAQEAELEPRQGELKGLIQKTLEDDEVPDKLHVKNAYLTYSPNKTEGINEPEIEGHKDIPLSQLPKALTRGIKVGGDTLNISQRFHREIVVKALRKASQDLPQLAHLARRIERIV